MKTRLLVFLFCVSLLGCSSSGQVAKDSRKVKHFTQISVSGGIDIQYTSGRNVKVTVEADKDRVDEIITEVRGNTLTVRRQSRMGRGLRHATVYVIAPTLEKISASGGSDFYAKKLENHDKLSISTSGGSDVLIEDLQVSHRLSISTSGGSDCVLKKVEVEECLISSSGGSDVSVDIQAERLTVSASGGSDVIIKGKVKDLKTSASGGSDIHTRDLKR